jgi:adenylate cyclase
VQDTLPDDARVIKTIGDEVMVVGSDGAALLDWAVGSRSCRPSGRCRASASTGLTLYRGRRLLRARGQPRRAGRRARGGWRGAGHAPARGRGRPSHLEFERIGEVKLKGFSESTELFLARQT